MKSLECKHMSDFNIGFIDPNRINKHTICENPKETEHNLLMFLVNQEYRSKILFLYNFRWVLLSYIHFSLLDVKCNWWVTHVYKLARNYHSILLKIEPDYERVEIFDLLKKRLWSIPKHQLYALEVISIITAVYRSLSFISGNQVSN
jgi:hypothetical protein